MLRILSEELPPGALPALDFPGAPGPDRAIKVLGEGFEILDPFPSRGKIFLPRLKICAGPACADAPGEKDRWRALDGIAERLRGAMRERLAEILARLAEASGPCGFRILQSSISFRPAGIPGKIGSSMELEASICSVGAWEGPESSAGGMLPSPKEIFAKMEPEAAARLSKEWLVMEAMES